MVNFLQLKDEQKKKIEPFSPMIKSLVFISGILFILISAIMLVSFSKSQNILPSQSKEMESMIQESQKLYPNTDLQNFIRKYDLILRKAYFSDVAFKNFGGRFLLVTFFIFIISFKLLYELQRPPPSIRSDKNNFKNLPEAPFLLFLLLYTCTAIGLTLFLKNNYLKDLKKTKVSTEVKVEISEAELKSNWTHFRGYQSLGIGLIKNIPLHWNGPNMENIRWKTPIEIKGFNSPIIWKNQIFLTGGTPKKREIYAFSKNTGKINWTQQTSSLSTQTIPEVTSNTGLAAPTMTCNGQFLAAIFATGELIVLSLDGKIIWEKKLPTPTNHYGHSSSLLSLENNLYVQYDHGEQSKVFCFEFSTGKIIWERNRDVDISWTSPILIPGQKPSPLLITVSTPKIIAYDALSGNQEWVLEDFLSGELGPSPAFDNNIIFVANQYALLGAINAKNGSLLWEYDDNLPDVSSPVAKNGILVLPSTYGGVTFMDTKTGTIHFYHEFEESCYASPIIINDKVYLLDKKGTMHILKLGKELDILASNSLEEESFATPAFCEGSIIIRTEKNLYSIGN